MARPSAAEPASTGVDIFDALADRVRESAAWLVGAFGAVGLLLVPGLQLADLGALDDTRLWVALGSVIVAAVALGIAVALIAPLLRSSATTIVDLGKSSRPWAEEVRAALNANRTLFRHTTSVGGLIGRDEDARWKLSNVRLQKRATADRLRRAQAALAGAPPAKVGQAAVACAIAREHDARVAELVSGAESNLREIEEATAAVEAVARFYEAAIRFRRARNRLVLCTVVVAGAMAALAIASHPPPPGVADFSHAHLTAVDLSGTDLRDATFAHATLTRVNLTGANLDGADLDDVTWRTVRCPDGHDSDDAGGTCEDHLTPSASAG
jgi:hypothetical protein